MAKPIRAGAAVHVDLGPRMGWSATVILRADGSEVSQPQSEADSAQFEIRLFVQLDDGRRVVAERDNATTLQTPIRGLDGWRLGVEELEAEVREAVFDDDLRELEEELREEDPELELGPDWEPLIAALRPLGVSASPQQLAGLPFAVELDDEARALLAG